MSTGRLRSFLQSRRCVAGFVAVFAAVELLVIGQATLRYFRETPSLERISSIRPGMTRHEVRQTLGSPINATSLDFEKAYGWIYRTPFDIADMESILPGQRLCVFFSSDGTVTNFFRTD